MASSAVVAVLDRTCCCYNHMPCTCTCTHCVKSQIKFQTRSPTRALLCSDRQAHGPPDAALDAARRADVHACGVVVLGIVISIMLTSANQHTVKCAGRAVEHGGDVAVLGGGEVVVR